MASNADLVFLPYNYLVDPRIRRTLAINLEECAVIVDEAHNVLQIFEDSSSISFKGKDVAVALSDLDYMLQIVEDENLASNIDLMPNVDTSLVYSLKDCFTKFDQNLIKFEKTIKTKSDVDTMDHPGDKIVELLNESGVNSGNAGAICLAITNVLDCLSVLNLAGAITKGKGLQKMSEVIELLFFQSAGDTSFDTRQKMKNYYKFYAEKKMAEGKVGQADTEYNLWCFHPGFSLSSLIGCKIRTLILTSGTLKPIDYFSYQLDQQFPVVLENDHVIDPKKQICYQVLTNGPDNTELLGTFTNSSNPKYLTSLGMAIIQIAKKVPDGLLIFFSSYRWLDTCVKHWQTYDGLWQQMNNIKECFVEPKDRNSLTKIVGEYRTRVKQSSPTGACFMAVCRGKISEGIDFADRDARAVVITGIPFPSVYDPKVKLKRKFLDSKKLQSKGISGSDWYNLEAFRALNQAIGRVIRHKDDFGAVLLLDKRFGNEVNAKRLPSWLEKSVVEPNFRKGIARLAQFYHHNRHNTKIKPQTVAPRTVIEKRPILSQSTANNMVMAPLNKKKKIVLKPRHALFSEATKNEIGTFWKE
jgi:regulator of telomere elongation helicase 1